MAAPLTSADRDYCVIAKNQAPMIGPLGPPRPPEGGAAAPGAGAGGGPYSGWKRYATCLTGSTLMVFAPRIVGTVDTTVDLSGESWCTTATLPGLPQGM